MNNSIAGTDGKQFQRQKPPEVCSVYDDCDREVQLYKWIESEKAGFDLGEKAIKAWVKHHWWGYLRARWIEHLQGIRFWKELDKGDFGLINNRFQDKLHLLVPILNLIKDNKENLDIIIWAIKDNIAMEDVREILLVLDINGKRLSHRFDT